MKVSIVVGGRWHSFELARGLYERGLLHKIITTYPRFKTRQWGIPDSMVVPLPATLGLERALRALKVYGHLPECQVLIHKLFSAHAARYLEGSTLVHCWAGFAEQAAGWCETNGVPLVLERSSAHMRVQVALLEEENRLMGRPRRVVHPEMVELMVREYERADRIVGCSRFVKRTFLEQGFPEEKVVVNLLGVDLAAFSPDGSVSPDCFRVVYAGMLSARKGIHYLVEAFGKLGEAGKQELLLVGGQTDETPLLLKNAGPGVKLTGHIPQSQLVHEYRKSSVFVLPSVEDGFGMVLTQALACGLPIIATENTGGEDLLMMGNQGAEPVLRKGGIREYHAGYVVPIRDSGALRLCMEELMQQPAKLKAKKEAAAAMRNDTMKWDAYVNRTVDCYRSLLGRD